MVEPAALPYEAGAERMDPVAGGRRRVSLWEERGREGREGKDRSGERARNLISFFLLAVRRGGCFLVVVLGHLVRIQVGVRRLERGAPLWVAPYLTFSRCLGWMGSANPVCEAIYWTSL